MAATHTRSHWSRLSITLHWLVVVLIIVQFLDHEYMVGLWDKMMDHAQPDQAVVIGGYIHIIAGVFILVGAAVRALDRVMNGRPPYPASDPTWATWLAKISHFLIYAILILMPALGLLAWYTGNDSYAGYHTFFWTPLLVLIAIHVVGALAQHFYFKSDALTRMVKPSKVG